MHTSKHLKGRLRPFVVDVTVGFSWFQASFHGFSYFLVDFSWFQVGFHGSRLVFHSSRWVFMVFLWFPVGFSWFQVGLSWFRVGFSWFQVGFNGFKLYSGQTIQSRPWPWLKAGFGLLFRKSFNFYHGKTLSHRK